MNQLNITNEQMIEFINNSVLSDQEKEIYITRVNSEGVTFDLALDLRNLLRDIAEASYDEANQILDEGVQMVINESPEDLHKEIISQYLEESINLEAELDKIEEEANQAFDILDKQVSQLEQIVYNTKDNDEADQIRRMLLNN